MKIGDNLSEIMKKGKFDTEFLAMLCEIQKVILEGIMLNETFVGMWEVSRLAEALNVEEEELAPQAVSQSTGLGFIGRIVGILRTGGQNPRAGILLNVGNHVSRPFWSTSCRTHFILGDRTEIIFPKCLTHILTARHCCIYSTLNNVDRYNSMVQALGCGFKFCHTKLDCSNTSNKYYVLLPRIMKYIEMLTRKKHERLPSIPHAEIRRRRM